MCTYKPREQNNNNSKMSHPLLRQYPLSTLRLRHNIKNVYTRFWSQIEYTQHNHHWMTINTRLIQALLSDASFTVHIVIQFQTLRRYLSFYNAIKYRPALCILGINMIDNKKSLSIYNEKYKKESKNKI